MGKGESPSTSADPLALSAKLVAVRRVTENRGKKTPGVDGEIWDIPVAKAKGVDGLQRGGYQPNPLRRVHIPKANGKMRPFGIPTIKDRAMQALYKLALEPVAEVKADPNSYGFRPGRATQDAMEQCFCMLAKTASPQWVLEGDIKGCFDHISHDWLLGHVPRDREILRKWLKAGFIEKDVFNQTEAGPPPGGIISPILANMAWDGLESAIEKKLWVPPKTELGKPNNNTRATHKVNLIRYADDFIITGASKELRESDVLPMVEQFLAERGLVLSKEKTKITPIDEGFDFLGWNVRKYQGKLLIRPAKKNIKSSLLRLTPPTEWITSYGICCSGGRSDVTTRREQGGFFTDTSDRSGNERSSLRRRSNETRRCLRPSSTKLFGRRANGTRRFIEADDLAIVDVHHNVPKVQGGPDTPANLVILHLNCHKQHHVLTGPVRVTGAQRRAATEEALRQYAETFPVLAPHGA
jgi:group II intron reverse transcriptase/maturase